MCICFLYFHPIRSLRLIKKDEKDDEKKKLAFVKSFNNWLQALCIFSSVLGEKSLGNCSGLFQHVDIVLKAYRNFGGWCLYDEMYRQKLSVHPGVKWGQKDVGLWINLMIPQRSNFSRQANTADSSNFRKGVCFAFDESQCKWFNNYRYRHQCSFWGGGGHPIV